MTINVKGQAEVDSKLVVNDLISNVEIHLDDYYPIVWDAKVTGNYSNDTINAGRIADVINQIPEYSFEAATPVDLTITLYWSWAFENNNGTSVGKAADLFDGDHLTSDEADTFLGILNNDANYGVANVKNEFTKDEVHDKYDGRYVLNMSFSFSVTMEQIQNA